MENPRSVYRAAMRRLQTALDPYASPVVCTRCAGWSSFGGVRRKDVSMGPICICTSHWRRLERLVRTMTCASTPISAVAAT